MDLVTILRTSQAMGPCNISKSILNKGLFPSDEAATMLTYPALKNIMAQWKRPPTEWHAALARLAFQFGDRFAMAAQ